MFMVLDCEATPAQIQSIYKAWLEFELTGNALTIIQGDSVIRNNPSPGTVYAVAVTNCFGVQYALRHPYNIYQDQSIGGAALWQTTANGVVTNTVVTNLYSSFNVPARTKVQVITDLGRNDNNYSPQTVVSNFNAFYQPYKNANCDITFIGTYVVTNLTASNFLAFNYQQQQNPMVTKYVNCEWLDYSPTNQNNPGISTDFIHPNGTNGYLWYQQALSLMDGSSIWLTNHP